MNISIPYYEDNTRLSNSNIGWFLNKGPSYLYKMLSGQIEEEKSQALSRGTMIHEYLLQPEEFQKDYVVWNERRPASAQEELFCQELANSIEIEPNKRLLTAYKAAYATTYKSEDKMLLEATKKASTLKEYIEFLKSKDEREMITPYQAKQLALIADNIRNHKAACKLLQSADNEKIFHEFHINWEYVSKDFDNNSNFVCSCKSLLDSVTFYFSEKKIILMDVKTSSHVHKFADSVNTYDYTRQLYYYTIALKWYVKNELHQDPDEWIVDWYIVAIDTLTNEVRVFNFTKDQITLNKDKVFCAIRDIVWHKDNNLWEHSRAYYEGNGIEKLNL